MTVEILKVVLVGPNANKTKTLNGVHFVDGVAEVPSNAAGLLKSLARYYQAFVVGSPELAEAQKKMEAEDRERITKMVEAGNKQKQAEPNKEPPPPPDNEKLMNAVLAIDPEIDDNWTEDGLPTMAAVEKAYGAGDVTRADVDAVLPGFTRDNAKARREQT